MRKLFFLSLCGILGAGVLAAKNASAYTCGPYTKTYTVSSLDGRAGTGVRCVLFSGGGGFSWYGEGEWGGTTYRHVGQGMSSFLGARSSIGYASDIFGNGEQTRSNFPGSLHISGSGESIPSQIYVRGAWNEVWSLEPSGHSNYISSLPAVHTCGSNFAQYAVQDTSGSNRSGSGVRCVLNITPLSLSTWYGEGNWDGKTYAHLGMNTASGYGAADICEPSRNSFCNNFPFGSLSVFQTRDQIRVSGAWSEAWIR